MAEPTMLEVREARGPFGRIFKSLFWTFQVLAMVAMLGTCAFIAPFVNAEDPSVAMGAGMLGAMAIGSLWVLWPLGSLVLGLLMLFSRGRKRLIPLAAAAPTAASRPASVPPTSAAQRR